MIIPSVQVERPVLSVIGVIHGLVNPTLASLYTAGDETRTYTPYTLMPLQDINTSTGNATPHINHVHDV